MAKRKAGRSTGSKTGGTRAAARRRGAKKATRKQAAAKSKPAGAKKTRARASSAARGPAKKAARAAKRTAPKASARKPAPRKSAVRKAPARAAAPKRSAVRQAAAKAKVPLRKAAARRSSERAVVRKAPALDRVRRTIAEEDDIVQTPPSSLDLNRTASAVRTGRREMRERFDQHTETSPALTGGDVDADWESAYSVGDEAPGGDNPTPDQDIVDDIGRAVGLQYEDNEELKGEKKISDRDAHRWELDPASAEDYNEHDQD